jgi:hypothetical protein
MFCVFSYKRTISEMYPTLPMICHHWLAKIKENLSRENFSPDEVDAALNFQTMNSDYIRV